jgi:PleD family two-component response regulator
VKQAPDEIAIVTQTQARAEVLKQAIVLRGFDEIRCLDAQTAAQACHSHPPVLVIVDMEGDLGKTVSFLDTLPVGVKSLVLANVFDEGFFVACHDRGARDFMVNPVPESLLVSRVIRSLQEHRLEQVSHQKDRILVELDVVSSQSGVFTTPYLINTLRRHSEEMSVSAPGPTCLLIVQTSGYQSPLPKELQKQLMSKVGSTIKECARGLDEVGEFFLDKFAVIMPDTSVRGAKALAKRIHQRLHGLTFDGPNGPWMLGIQVGVAEYAGCRHYEDFLNRALEDLKGSTPTQAAPRVNPIEQPALSRPSNLI